MSTLTQGDLGRLQLEELLLRPHVCNAPFVSLNFSQSGNINACCMGRKHSLGYYPETSIIQAWTGQKMKDLRQAIDSFDFSKGCQMCYKQIINGNYENSLLKSFQVHEPLRNALGFPTVLEFEISSICNYECIMCGGKWSSSIRKNRERLPPLKSPYDINFVKQLEFFIPHVQEAHFLGGEPFATPIYFDIWEKFNQHNINTVISATTNGSIYNKRVRDVLNSRKTFNLCFSIDSLNPETYAFIRKNGNLQNVLENFKKVRSETTSGISIAFCPMIQNWHEIPDVIEFCRKYKTLLVFNNVEGYLGGEIYNIHENATKEQIYADDDIEFPRITNKLEQKIPEVRLQALPDSKKIQIINFLEKLQIPEQQYKKMVQGLINKIKCSLPQ